MTSKNQSTADDPAYDRSAIDPHWGIRPNVIVSKPAHALYNLAFIDYRGALWNVKHLKRPTAIQVLLACKALRLHGSLKARAHAERLEAAIHAAH